MHHTTSRTARPVPDPSETLAILEDAMRTGSRGASSRAIASDDPRSVDDGLTVLRCYVAIADRQVRQAILDMLVAAADSDPEVQCDPCSWKPGAS